MPGKPRFEVFRPEEDHVDGRFFAKRFDCERLETPADILACSPYVDLN